MPRRLALVGRLPQRRVLQAVDDVVAHAHREEVRRGADVGEGATGQGLGRAHQVDAAELETAAGRRQEARHDLGQLARPLPADDGDVLIQPGLERDVLQHACAAVVDQGDARSAKLAGTGELGQRDDERLGFRRRHFLAGELLDHLLVLDLDVEALLVPVDQLLHRRGQVLVGGDHRDQRADVELAGDHEIAADRVEQERRHLREEVVEELDHELALVELEADAEDGS